MVMWSSFILTFGIEFYINIQNKQFVVLLVPGNLPRDKT